VPDRSNQCFIQTRPVKSSQALSLAALCLGGAGAAHAWEPTKPVEIVVPFSAGGVLLLSQHFGWRRGQRPRVPAV
jgi:hypothetical protein